MSNFFRLQERYLRQDLAALAPSVFGSVTHIFGRILLAMGKAIDEGSSILHNINTIDIELKNVSRLSLVELFLLHQLEFRFIYPVFCCLEFCIEVLWHLLIDLTSLVIVHNHHCRDPVKLKCDEAHCCL